MSAETKQSLALGDDLTDASWDEFVGRLRHDCVGAGVQDHCTADAIFIVEARKIIYGLDPEYSDKRLIVCDDWEWSSPQEYWDECDEDDGMRERLDAAAQESGECDFLQLSAEDQWDVIGELDDHQVLHWDDRWEYVNSHFTKDAAEAFIRRKKHDYPKGLRVYVDAQSYCWEFNTIKKAILDGRLTLAK